MRGALLTVAAATGIAAGGFFACGESDATGGGKRIDPRVDETFRLQIDGVWVDVPPGAFSAGTSVQLVTGATPELFRAQDEAIPAADVAAELQAATADGAAVAEALKPIKFTMSVTRIAALLGVEAKDEDLCVFAVNRTEQGLVWRRTGITVTPGARGPSFESVWLGTYQIYYCGATPLIGMIDVADTGDRLRGAGAASYGSCDLRDGATALGTCRAYYGAAYAVAANVASFIDSCRLDGGVFLANSACPPNAALGDCVFEGATTSEYLWTYYPADGAATSDAAAAACAVVGGVWHSVDQ